MRNLANTKIKQQGINRVMTTITLPSVATQCAIVNVDSKKQVLEKIALLASEMDTSLNYKDVMDALQRRERLGSTAMGHGVAIPHTRIQSLKNPLCIVLRLSNPTNFSENEVMPVNIVFALLVPEEADETHLQLLAQISRRCGDKKFREHFLAANDNQDLFHLVNHE